MRIAIGLATAGRPETAMRAIADLAKQTRQPDAIVVSVPALDDLASNARDDPRVHIVTGPRGLTRQRNAILDQTELFDVVVFIDDDFVADEGYLAAVERAFVRHPNLVAATGVVLADGITGPGYDHHQAEAILASTRGARDDIETTYSAYGCNMAFRLDVARRAGVRFDERLPFYGWLEDVDFSRRMADQGQVARIMDAFGVHLGVKGARQSGLRFGYSQIANPIYLVRKGSYTWPRAAWLMGRNLLKNLVLAWRPEAYVDRIGRLRGNGLALSDWLRGHLTPTQIERLP